MPGSKPIHPATVHFPITFLTLSYTLTLLNYLLSPPSSSTTTTTSPPILSTLLSPLLTPLSPLHPHLPLLSSTLLLLGILTGIPAILSGGAQMSQLLSHAGIYEADGKTIRPKIKVAFLHAALNDIVFGVAAWTWWVGRAKAGEGESSGGKAALAQTTTTTGWEVAVGALSLPVLIFASSLGGSLVYNYGVGLQMGKKGKTS